jgi:hypothetical protein
VARGGGTTPPFPMMFGGFGGGLGSNISNLTGRGDYDLEAIWELRNLGLGNKALIRERRAERDLFQMELYRARDLVASQAVEALAEVQSAFTRMHQAEEGLRQGLVSYDLNFKGLGEIKRVGGDINILVIRPQEVDSALQDLITAYFDYFGTVADYNRAQFQLYWAIGNPGQALGDLEGYLHGNGNCGNPGDCSTCGHPVPGPAVPGPVAPVPAAPAPGAPVPPSDDKSGETAAHH